MSELLQQVHAVVDDVGGVLRRETARRPFLGPRLLPAGLDRILELMDTVPDKGRRELVWNLILQGFDRRILGTASRQGAASYRSWTAAHAPEVLRPEDEEPYRFRMSWGIPEAIGAVMDPVDRIGACVQRRYRELGRRDDELGDRPHIGGQDEVLVTEEHGYVMGMDGRIWRVHWSDGALEIVCRPPRMPTGAVLLGSDIYFCATRWSERVPPAERPGGIYRMSLEGDPPMTAEPVALRVPWREEFEWGPVSRSDDPASVTVYSREEIEEGEMSLDEVEALAVSRPICYANDLAIDDEGRYLYFTESSPYTSMGLESRVEIVKLTRNGRLWRVDLEERRIGLVAEDLAFVDGVVTLEDRVLVTELGRFRMLELDLEEREARVVVRDLPGMPDGTTRFDGFVWQALLHERTTLITLLHRHTWVKRLYQLLPDALKKAPPGCGILVLDETTLEPVYCTMHDGARLHHLATVTPHRKGVFLPSFHEGSRGLHWIPNPLTRR